MSHVHIGMYETLRKLGADDESAKAAVADLPIPQHLATKEDMVQAFGEIKTEIAELRGEVKASIAELRGEVKAETANLKADCFRQLWFMAAGIVTLNTILMTAIVTLTRFFSG